MDEMKIQENLVWDKHTGELIGYVDLGDITQLCNITQGQRNCISCSGIFSSQYSEPI